MTPEELLMLTRAGYTKQDIADIFFTPQLPQVPQAPQAQQAPQAPQAQQTPQAPLAPLTPQTPQAPQAQQAQQAPQTPQAPHAPQMYIDIPPTEHISPNQYISNIAQAVNRYNAAFDVPLQRSAEQILMDRYGETSQGGNNNGNQNIGSGDNISL